MTNHVTKCSDFLRVLLRASKIQAEALLVTASAKQVDCISEIAINLQILPLGTNAKRLVMKSKKILDSISNLATSTKSRLEIIQKYVKRIIAILNAVKNRLLVVLKSST